MSAVAAGVSSLSSSAASIGGALVAATQRGLGRTATSALVVANAIEGPKTIGRLTPLAVVGSIAGDVQASRNNRAITQSSDDGDSSGRTSTRQRQPNWRFRTLNTIAALQLARAGATGLGTALARLSRSPGGAIRTRNYFGGRDSVTMRSWDSRLSAALNAGDVGPGLRVKASYGRMYESDGKAWHAGTTAVNSSRGERTVTHLQSMNWPTQHYYFDRSLTDQEIAGTTAGHQAFQAKQLPGFAGEISEIESLTPLLGRAKKSLIKTHLFWGD
jgi:hypothetical protein